MFNRNYVHRNKVIGTGIIAFLAGAFVWGMFGKRLKKKLNGNPDFQDLKRQVYDKANSISDLTQEKYNNVVDEVTRGYAQMKGISQNELRDLVSDLKWHWKRIQESWKNNRYQDSSGAF